MNSDKTHQLPSTFKQPQTRKLRSNTARDKNAWKKLIRTSPQRLTEPRKASTSKLTIDVEEDGLPVRAIKRTCYRSDSTSKLPVPWGDCFHEAMSELESLHINNLRPLQDKSNTQLLRKPSSAHQKLTELKAEQPSALLNIGETHSPLWTHVPTSTPPQGSSQSGDGFAALEAADLSSIASVSAVDFRFTGLSQLTSQSTMSPRPFTLRGLHPSTSQGCTAWQRNSVDLPSHKEARGPSLWAGLTSPNPRHNATSDDDDAFADVIHKQLALNVPTVAMPLCTSPEIQQTPTSEGHLASESEVDVLQPLRGRKRKVSKVRLILDKTSYTSLKAKKKSTKHRSRASSEISATATQSQSKNISPSAVQHRTGVLAGMRGTKGSLIRDTPAKAGPETSVDELGLV